MKKKNDIKLKNSLKDEQKVLIALIIISAVSLIFSLIIELFSNYNTPLYWNYIKNILFGLSGSAIISFIIAILPFNRNKKTQINSIRVQLIDIYKFYLITYSYLKGLSNGENRSNTYSADIKIFHEIDVISKKITNVIEEYKYSDLSSDSISNISKLLDDKMRRYLDAIKKVYKFILPEKILNREYDTFQDVKKDYQYKIKQKDYFAMLIEILDEILPEAEIRDLFMAIGVSGFRVANDNLINSLEDIVESINRLQKEEKSLHLSLKISSSLINIQNKWENYNAQEYDKYKKELDEIIFNRKINLKKHSKLIDEIHFNLRELDFEKTEKNIELLRKAVEEEN